MGFIEDLTLHRLIGWSGLDVAVSGEETFTNTSTGRLGTIQTWTSPASITATIEVWGASGGVGDSYGYFGKGARMKGDFEIPQGTQLQILVGQMGQDNFITGGGGGGGGTFVVGPGGPLIVAGGGGGGAFYSNTPSPSVIDGRTGNSGPNYVATGRDTAGGAGGSYSAYNTASVNYGRSFTAGGAGGSNEVDGGFGGGGGATGNNLAPGGGGYSGGDEHYGYQVYQGGPGGGGSYNSGTNQSNTSGVRTGHGLVVITY